MDEVNRFFRPEFLNRMDEIINFNPLERSDLFRIIDIEMAKVEERIRSRGLVLHLSDKARDFLIDNGFNPQYGARPLRRAIERFVEDPMAEEMLRGHLPNNSLIELDYEAGAEKLSFKAEAANPEDGDKPNDGIGGDAPTAPAVAGSDPDIE